MQTINKLYSDYLPIFLFLFIAKSMFVSLEIFKTTNVSFMLNEFMILTLMLSSIRLSPLKNKLSIYVLVNFIISFFYVVVLIYFSQFNRIIGIENSLSFEQLPAIKESIFSLVKPKYYLLFIDFFTVIPVMIWLKKRKQPFNYIGKKFVLLSLILTLTFSGANIIKGFYLSQEYSNVALTNKVGLINYQIYNTVSFLKDKPLENFKVNYTDIRELKNNIDIDNPNYFGIAKDKNVLVIQIESLQNFPINLKVNGVEITPTINELIKESFYFPNFYHQIGQGNTSDAEFMTNTSIYPLETGVMGHEYSNREIPSFPKILKEYNYTSLTFHPNVATFWDRDKLYPALGFDKYYDLEFFGKEDIIGIGPSDEVLYEKSLPILTKLKNGNKKFYANLITLSSHHPFTLPSDKGGIELPKEFNNSLVGNYLKSVNYDCDLWRSLWYTFL